MDGHQIRRKRPVEISSNSTIDGPPLPAAGGTGRRSVSRPQPEPAPAKRNRPMPRKRPFSVTLLLWMVLSLSAWGAVRLSGALHGWDVLTEFGARLSPIYLSITGAGWGVAGGVLLFNMLTIKTWARPAILTSILLWLIEYWIERIFFQSSRANLLFVLTGSIIVITVATAATFKRSTKLFFSRSEEHEQPDENTNPE